MNVQPEKEKLAGALTPASDKPTQFLQGEV
jgi:hypothetical protein